MIIATICLCHSTPKAKQDKQYEAAIRCLTQAIETWAGVLHHVPEDSVVISFVRGTARSGNSIAITDYLSLEPAPNRAQIHTTAKEIRSWINKDENIRQLFGLGSDNLTTRPFNVYYACTDPLTTAVSVGSL